MSVIPPPVSKDFFPLTLSLSKGGFAFFHGLLGRAAGVGGPVVEEIANPDKAETLELFRANGAKASAIVRGLSDAELDRSGTVLTDIPAMTVQQAIEGILINHVHEHLGSIRATTGAK